MSLQPYRTWTRLQLSEHIDAVIDYYDPNNTDEYEQLRKDAKRACYSEQWNPLLDYNGCNAVPDPHHPYPPCLIHDFDWVVKGGGKKYDKKFEYYNTLCGMKSSKAKRWFIGVRAGWLSFFKWKKR